MLSAKLGEIDPLLHGACAARRRVALPWTRGRHGDHHSTADTKMLKSAGEQFGSGPFLSARDISRQISE
jgi:hypothetical protein